ncbi:MAG: cation:proton antiporter [Acidimicrobiia bacterium]
MHEGALLLLELGGIVLGLGLLGRLAARFGFSPIPLYLIGGLAIGDGGIAPIVISEDFIEIGAEIGVVLLLLMLGLEFTGRELVSSVRSTAPVGFTDLAINAAPGLIGGLVLGLGPTGALFLGGVTYISSSGVIAKLISDLGWLANRETPAVLSLLVFEDLAMAVLLPVLGAIAIGGEFSGVVLAATAALVAVALILAIGARHGDRISRAMFSSSDEVNLLTLLGITLLVAGAAERLSVSAAVGAFLVGIGVSGEAVGRARTLLAPLRDLFAAVFFVFFGIQTDPRALPPIAFAVLALAVASSVTKLLVGWWAAARVGAGRSARLRAGVLLVARGEFSIVIAGLGLAAGVDERLGLLAVGYVLVTAVVGPVAAKIVDSRSVSRPGPRSVGEH